jgi:hypothetical protein
MPIKARSPTPDDVLESLKSRATARTQRSLDILHTICSEQHKRASRDFSVATIGRLSAERGGPSAQPIRNKTGEDYRTLLAAWAAHVNGLTRKPPVRPEFGIADDVLNMIEDAAVRAVVGFMLAENRKLKNENTLLKQQATVIVDRREQRAPSDEISGTPAPLLTTELEALRDSISKEFLQRMGWAVDKKNGRVTAGARPIYRPGYATAIAKILVAYSQPES